MVMVARTGQKQFAGTGHLGLHFGGHPVCGQFGTCSFSGLSATRVPLSPIHCWLISMASRLLMMGQILSTLVLFVKSKPSTSGELTMHLHTTHRARREQPCAAAQKITHRSPTVHATHTD
jgi:hypothetical protein